MGQTRFRNNFIAGKMNKDTDSRLVPAGEYRDALNFSPSNSSADSAGAMENALSNKQLTSVSLGTGPYYTLGMYVDKTRDRLYWFVKSNTGSYVVEYDTLSGITAMVLEDTSAGVLNFDENYLITGAALIFDSDNDVSFLMWTDNKNPVRFINVERAKSYGPNNFEEADVSLIKAPPLSAPVMVLSSTPGDQENNLEQRFLRFAYRYKYEDGQYSALSPFTDTAFLPQQFSYDYATSSNESMVNQFNEVDLTYETGPKRVTDIELVFKESGSNTVYIIDTINKFENQFLDNDTQTFTFSNNQVYRALAADQLTRLYDAVPLKAKALEVIGNRLMIGNYTENYDIADANGVPIKVDYLVSVVSSAISTGTPTESNKSNRDYEIGIVYLDDNGRQTTVLTSPTNTAYIPNSDCVNENRFQVTIANEPPAWATKYRFYIKQSRTDYDTIVPSFFYQDGVYVWIKVEANETDKFDVGDFIYIKSDSSQFLQEAIQVRVLEIVDQPVNFLEETAPSPFEELQQAGRYFKIKPDGFRLNEDDFILHEAVSLGFRSQVTSNNFVNDTTYYVEDPVYYGTIGLNDISVSGTYTGATDIRYIVDINAVGATDEFRWSNDNGATWSANIPITGSAQTIEEGIQVTFTFTTGHQLDDQWILSAKSGAETIAWRENSAGSAAGTVARSAIIHYAGKPSTAPGGETIKGGATITIIYDDTASDGANPGISFTQNFTATQDYANLEEWFFGDNIINTIEYPTTLDNVLFRRGAPSKSSADGFEQWTIDPNGDQMGMCVASNEKYSGTERIYVNKFNTPSIQIRELSNNIVFETIPEVDNSEIYYETADTYDISGGYHLGKAGDTNQANGVDAVINLNTFNCFSWGNGFESYKIKDLFNARTMALDSRPSGAIEDYRENVRIADITWSKVYEQGTNFNGLNEFNLSTANFKQMDDRYQSIQHLYSEDTNLLVLQEDKVHNVPYQKDILFGADGSEVVRESNNILGTERAYAGEYGISTNPESFAVYGNRKYWVDTRRGAVLRLSLDGITEISQYGMADYFSDSFRALPYSKKLGAYDLHDHQYILTVYDTDGSPVSIVPCGAFINFYQLESAVTYTLRLNQSDQPVVVNYDAGAGTVNINVFDGTSNFSSGNVTGSGNYQFNKTTSNIDEVTVTVTPVSTLPSVSIDVPCPVDLIVAANDSATVFRGKSVTIDVLANDTFASQVTVTIDTQGAKGTAVVNPDKTITYTHANADALPDSFIYQINDGNSTDTGTVNLTVVQLDAVADSMQVFELGSSDINVLANDFYDANDVPTVTITVQGSFGTATVNPDKSITYNHTSGTTDDTFTYQISDGASSDTAVVSVDVIPDTGGGGGSEGQSFLMSGIGYDGGSNGEGACGFSLTQTKYHDGASVYPTLADTVYNELNKSTTFNGQNLYWAIDNGRSIKISQSGVITDLWICGAGNA